MAIERWKPEDKDKVVFSFLTPAEGREALKMAIDLVAGECGEFTFLPIGGANKDILAIRGYVAFAIRGDENALSSLTIPKVRDMIKEELKLSDDDLDSMVSPHIKRHGWFKRPNADVTGLAPEKKQK